MKARLADRTGAIAHGVERLHQPDGGPGIVRVVRKQSLPAIPGSVGVPRRTPLRRQLRQCPAPLPAEPFPFLIDPTLEFGRLAEEESIQQGAHVESGRAFPVASREGLLEGQDIALQLRRVEAEVVADGKDHALPERFPHHVDRLFQEVSSMLGVALGPEIAKQLVAAEGAGVGKAQQRQEGQAVTLGHRAAQDRAIALERGTAEELQGNHAEGAIQGRFGRTRAGPSHRPWTVSRSVNGR